MAVTVKRRTNPMKYLKTAVQTVIPKEYRSRIFNAYATNIRPILYVGNDVTCPCCNSNFRKFLPSGHTPRPNVACPNCFCLERHRLLWLYLQNKTDFFSKKIKVLHIAPEPYFQKVFSKLPNLEYLTADLSDPNVDLNFDITDIPFKDNYFDAILCNHVLEHVPDDGKAMRELHRVIQPEGWAILQVPIDIKREETFEDWKIVSPEERAIFFGQHDHVRVYGLDYKTRLESAGFKVKVDDYVTQLGADAINKYRLPATENIYFCTK